MSKSLTTKVFLLLLIFSHSTVAQNVQKDKSAAHSPHETTKLSNSNAALNRLRKSFPIHNVVMNDDGSVRALYGEIRIADTTGKPEEDAFRFLDKYPELFGIKNPRAEYILDISQTASSGEVNVRLVQHADSVPVHGGEVLITFWNNAIVRVYGGYVKDLAVPSVPNIDIEKARAVVVQDLGLAKEDCIFSREKLRIYTHDNKEYLAWYLYVFDAKAIDGWHYNIDATNGAVIFRQNATTY